ncbi:hypothetical protein SO802_030178 [Lithocarpus litseifolius]|uniref:Uncharacterized protein n=1 Tax=Lithocarpus litseifolius TaxID=425828 RepID=A0AAW2BYK3_9ROSI
MEIVNYTVDRRSGCACWRLDLCVPPFNSRLLPQILTKPILPQKRKVTKKEFALFGKRLKETFDTPEAVSSDPETVTIIPQVKLEHSIQEERHKSKGQGQITITGCRNGGSGPSSGKLKI